MPSRPKAQQLADQQAKYLDIKSGISLCRDAGLIHAKRALEFKLGDTLRAIQSLLWEIAHEGSLDPSTGEIVPHVKPFDESK